MGISLGKTGTTEVIYIKNKEKNFPFENQVKDIFKAEYLETILLPLEDGKIFFSRAWKRKYMTRVLMIINKDW
ncbi:MAG: hypothetical protein ACTTG8_08940 [Catonella sp.]|uniref:hypothetical protein n=1 Tax=Catonella sp. TaxID=2382125 RepID=UPI003FA04013